MERHRGRRSPAAIAQHLRMLHVITFSWTVDAALLAMAAHLAGLSYTMPLIYLSLGLSSAGVGYFLTATGLGERLADPSLSYPMMLAGVLIQCTGLWLAPEVGVFFLINLFQVFAYGLISLDERHFRALTAICAAATALPIMLVGSRIAFPLDTWSGQLLLLVVLLACLARFVGVGIFVSMLRERISAKKAELAQSEARFRALTELSSDWYWEQDAELRFTRIASGNRNDLVLPREALIGKRASQSGFELELEGGWDALMELVKRRAEFRDLVMKRSAEADQEYVVCVSGQAVFDRNGKFSGYRGVAREITAQRQAEQRIQYLATHDGLTGLPNRMMFNEMVAANIESSRRYGRSFALLFIDLDGFKRINDSLGHEAGDALLKELAARFRASVRASDVVARLGGDEFVVIAGELESPRQAEAVAQKLLEMAALPTSINGLACAVSASIGVALFPQDASDEQGLLKFADGAMYAAKQSGRNHCRFHSGGAVANSAAAPTAVQS